MGEKGEDYLEMLMEVVAVGIGLSVKALFDSSQKTTRKFAANAFKYCDWMKVLAASLRVSFCDKWKRAIIVCVVVVVIAVT